MSPSRDDHVANASEASEDDPVDGGSEAEVRSAKPPRKRPGSDETRPNPAAEWARWAWTVDDGPVMWVRELVVSVGAVVLVGLLLFALSGVWPPMVAIESGSMEPHMQKGDLVFVADPDRFSSSAAYGDTGVVPAEQAEQATYQKFGGYGDVIVFKPNGDDDRTPIIHRAHLWVSEGDDWYDRADPSYLGGAENCDELRNCPAPHDGFITRGDNNSGYDQVQGQSDPVKEEWVIATARVRVPWLGWIRLYVSEIGISASMWIEGVLIEEAPQNTPLTISEPAVEESNVAIDEPLVVAS